MKKENFYRSLGEFTIIIGIIGSFILAYRLGLTSSITNDFDVEETRDWVITIVAFIAGVFSSSVIGCVLIGINDILDKLNFMSENTEEYSLERMKETEPAGWICSNCGTRNHPTSVGCRQCGTYK